MPEYQSKNAPAYQTYASDIIADRRYRMMSLDERGLYITLNNECWVNKSLPANLEELSKFLGLPQSDVENSLTDLVKTFFKFDKKNIFSPDLEKYRSEQELRREKQSKGGRKGAEGKWNKGLDDMANPLGKSMGNPMATPMTTPMASRVEMRRAEKSREEPPYQGEDLTTNTSSEEYPF